MSVPEKIIAWACVLFGLYVLSRTGLGRFHSLHYTVVMIGIAIIAVIGLSRHV